MKNVFIIAGLILTGGATALAQSVKPQWAISMAGNSYDACKAIALDNDGNVYATGYFSATVDFDGGPGVYNLTSVNAEDAYMAKYDPAGKLVWAKNIGDFRYQAGNALTLDAAGNIYVTGIFFGTTDFDPGPGVANLVSAGNEDVFVCKYDNSGNFTWAKRVGGPTNEFCNAIKADAAGNIYINGYFENTADFDPGIGVYNLISAGATDIFVCKLDNNGLLQWAKQIGGPSADVAFDIELDNTGNVYSTGFYFATVDFDPGPGIFNLTSTALGDGYILKLGNGGNFITAARLGGNSRVRCMSLKTDIAGNICLAGYFDGEADFDPGNGSFLLSSPVDDDDIFIGKYDLDLNLVWIKQVGGPSFQKVFDVETDDAGNIYTTGHYNGTADFDAGPGEQKLIAAGDPDIFVLKMNAAGGFVWVAPATGPFFGSGYSIRLNTSGDIYVGGTFEGTKDFDPGPDEIKKTSAGQSEMFIYKLRQCPNAAIEQVLDITSCTSYTLYNKTYTASGTYSHAVLNASGCDSIIIKLNLTISRIINTVTAAICEGDIYVAGGMQQTKSGIYYDTLTNAAGCDSVVITHLIVREKPKPALGNDRNLCEGQSLILDPGNFESYLWQDFSVTQQYTVTKPGTYLVSVTNAFNCKASARIIIRGIARQPANFLPADQDLCSGNILKIQVPGFRSYLWSTGASAKNIDIIKGGNYYLTVTSFDNCTGTDTLNIREVSCIPIGIPNAFSPNSDGKNDFFKPTINYQVKDYQLHIFNRAGQLIFQTKDYAIGWDGRLKGQQQSSDNYIYQISFRNMEGKQFEYKGNILLIR
ncbi:MAG: gliding motility-associated C-terminal domain-containing protein [Ferruginibacter sp.]|nr:gliding motility-associated C-terminal domain-containing protein [Ferruginibacter sp.]